MSNKQIAEKRNPNGEINYPDLEPQTSVRDLEENNADFETAITATKFGKFNIILFLLSIPGNWTSTFETTTMAYVFPAAHCDLNLSLKNRGSLNAITFFGMVSSGFLWGFLCDTLGRKKLLVVGYLLDSFFVILSSFSQNFTMLIVFKFFGGFIINGPFTALTTYLSEFHCSKYRSRVQLARGMFVSCGNLMLPLWAWAILPQEINIVLFDANIVLHSWNIFLLICAVPSLVSGIIFFFMPESPKFLMTVGRNAEALAVFKKIYSFNTGKNKDDFPITTLIDETTITRGHTRGGQITANRTKIQALREGFQQIKPLCFPPHIKHVILVCSIQSMSMMSTHTLRLWLPQIFQSISDYQYYNNGSTNSLCTMLESLSAPKQPHETCYINFSSAVYINTIIVAAVSMFGYVMAGSVINILGKKLLLSLVAGLNGVVVISIYFSQNTATVTSLSSLYLAIGAVSGNVVITIVIELFPTQLRASTVSMVMMFGRLAAMVGNLIFPILLSLGCAPPFFTLGAVVIACALLAILLPNTEMKALQ